MWHGKRSQSKKGHGNSSAAQTSTEIHFLADDFLPDLAKAWLNKTPGEPIIFRGFWFMFETATHNNNWANCQLGGRVDFFTPRETFSSQSANFLDYF